MISLRGRLLGASFWCGRQDDDDNLLLYTSAMLAKNGYITQEKEVICELCTLKPGLCTNCNGVKGFGCNLVISIDGE